MKILLISVNREKMPFPVFPLGLAYIAKALTEEGHSIDVMDLCFSQEVSVDLKSTLHRFQPDLIGISVRNLDNLTYPTSVSYLKEVEEVVGVCRQQGSSRLVIGGSGYSLAPKELLRHFDVDFGIVGEGEEIFLRLARDLEKGASLSPSPDLLIKGKPFPLLIEGARVFLSKILIVAFSKRIVIWKKEGWAIFRRSGAAPSPASTAPIHYSKGRR